MKVYVQGDRRMKIQIQLFRGKFQIKIQRYHVKTKCKRAEK